MALVTLQQAVDHLLLPIQLDTTPPDPRQNDLALKLAAAEAIILGYLKTYPVEWVDETTTPADVQACILLQLTELYRFRGDDPQDQGAAQHHSAADPGQMSQLSPHITNILRRRRDPALAGGGPPNTPAPVPLPSKA
jgi:hypothetical protein